MEKSMQDYASVFINIIPVIGLLLVGYLLQQLKFFMQDTVEEIKKLVLNVSLPCLMFLAFYSLELQIKFVSIVAVIFVLCVCMFLLGKIIAKILSIQNPYFPLNMGGVETGMLGYAIFISVYGIQNIDKIAICDLGVAFYLWFFLVPILLNIRESAPKPLVIVKMSITSPTFIAIFLGIIMSGVKNVVPLTQNRLYPSLYEFVSMVGSMTVPLICINIGYGIHINLRSIGLPLKTIMFRLVLHTGFMLVINKLFFVRVLGLDAIYEYALITMLSLPPSFVPSLFIRETDTENREYMLNTLSLHTVISIAAFVLITSLYR
jgi:predicted permease